MKKVITASVAALVVAFSVSALAQEQKPTEIVVQEQRVLPPGVEVRTKIVNFGDLDATKQEGAHALLVRIRAAAKDVCAPDPGMKDQKLLADYNNCRTHAVDSAVARLNNALVTAEHSKG